MNEKYIWRTGFLKIKKFAFAVWQWKMYTIFELYLLNVLL